MSLFDQLGKIVTNPGAQAVPAFGKHAALGENRTAYLERLDQSKIEVEQRLSGLFTELGRVFYESHANDHQTEYEAQMAAIRDAYADIAQCKKQISEITNRRRCPSCGAELAEGSMFCNFCGTKLQDAVPDQPDGGAGSQRLCPQCHAVLEPDDMFCTSCGADVRGGGQKSEG